MLILILLMRASAIGSINAFICIQSKWNLRSLSFSDHQLFTYFIISGRAFFKIISQGQIHGDSYAQYSCKKLWIIHECQSNYSPSANLILLKTFRGQSFLRLVFRLMEVTTSRHRHTNGQQPDRRPANGGCILHPGTCLTLQSLNYTPEAIIGLLPFYPKYPQNIYHPEAPQGDGS